MATFRTISVSFYWVVKCVFETEGDDVTDFLERGGADVFSNLCFVDFCSSNGSDVTSLRLIVFSDTQEDSSLVFKDGFEDLETEVLDAVSEVESTVEDDGTDRFC